MIVIGVLNDTKKSNFQIALIASHSIDRLKVIKNIINNTVYDSEPTYITNKGDVIVTYKELLDDKENGNSLLKPIFKYLSYYDVWIGLSEFYNSSNLSVVELLTSSNLFFKVSNFKLQLSY